MDPIVAAAIVSAIAGVLGPAILLVLGKKINETHRQVTVNHHSSSNPTIKDLLNDILKWQENHDERHRRERRDED